MMDGPVVKTTSNLGNVTSLEWRVLPRGNGGVEVSLVPRRRSDGCLCGPTLRLGGVRLLLVLKFVARRKPVGLQMRSASRMMTCGPEMWFLLASG